MEFLENYEKREKADILNFSQQKEEETIWCRNQIIILQSVSQKFY